LNFTKIFVVRKLHSLGYHFVSFVYDRFSHLTGDMQTDGQDMHYASRGKNGIKFLT